MTPITILGVLGDRSGVRTAQVSLSHGFGDGGAQSCEFTVDAVSNLLLGTQIDFYIAHRPRRHFRAQRSWSAAWK